LRKGGIIIIHRHHHPRFPLCSSLFSSLFISLSLCHCVFVYVCKREVSLLTSFSFLLPLAHTPSHSLSLSLSHSLTLSLSLPSSAAPPVLFFFRWDSRRLPRLTFKPPTPPSPPPNRQQAQGGWGCSPLNIVLWSPPIPNTLPPLPLHPTLFAPYPTLLN
jgi:hypothetical protein